MSTLSTHESNNNILPLTADELLNLKKDCLINIQKEELHRLQNDAKLRAVNTSKTYEEFKDIVDAAHLQPLSFKDKQNAKTKSRLWNSTAKEH